MIPKDLYVMQAGESFEDLTFDPQIESFSSQRLEELSAISTWVRPDIDGATIDAITVDDDANFEIASFEENAFEDYDSLECDTKTNEKNICEGSSSSYSDSESGSSSSTEDEFTSSDEKHNHMFKVKQE
ncbi:hypothetical protein PanWU01x14_231380 [Parasponia andersonii]|uniref:Uncharacterized protein n=1 Tax=Parasponia andersonii TaxID=3476 RepID=A0A2P5BKG8_PARAD|nr:hypothetical protein PanWU01x14_231380 [Parasponia andersonii]